MIKTRIVERNQGEAGVCTPEVFVEAGSMLLGVLPLNGFWTMIGDYPYPFSTDYEKKVALGASKYRIDTFLMNQGLYEEIVHWYPEVRDD